MRDKVEKDMVNLITRVSPNGTPFDPSVRTELDELSVEATIHDLNRLLFCEFVVFLSSAPTTDTSVVTAPIANSNPELPGRLDLAMYEKASINTARNREAVMKLNASLDAVNPSVERTQRRDLSRAIQQRIQEMAENPNQSSSAPDRSTTIPIVTNPTQRTSSRQRSAK